MRVRVVFFLLLFGVCCSLFFFFFLISVQFHLLSLIAIMIFDCHVDDCLYACRALLSLCLALVHFVNLYKKTVGDDGVDR